MYKGHRYPLRSRRGMITHFVISTQTINSSSSQKGEKAIEISASVFRSKIRVLMSPDSAIGSTKRPLGGHLYGFLQRRARVITMDLVGSPGAPSATHELVRRLLRLPHIIGTVTTDYGSRCISVGQCNKRNQEIKERNWGGQLCKTVWFTAIQGRLQYFRVKWVRAWIDWPCH